MMQDKIRIAWSMDAGRPGLDSDPANPLSRSLARLIRTGKPFARLSLSFLDEGGGQLRWFGVFAEGKRTLFFPGFSMPFDGVESRRGQGPVARSALDFDHISLEQDRETWHVTARESLDHLNGPRTLSLGKERVLWFGLSFASLDAFLPVYDRTSVEFQSPASDTERRRAIIHDARKNAEFPILSLPSGQLSSLQDTYFHASVIAGPAGFEAYRGGEHALPVGSPYLASSFPSPVVDQPARIHRLQLSLNTDLQITVMKLVGKLTVPVAFTGSEAPNGYPGPRSNNACKVDPIGE